MYLIGGPRVDRSKRHAGARHLHRDPPPWYYGSYSNTHTRARARTPPAAGSHFFIT